jgi:T5SS/PEP-CTERM-associated repeat protein
VINSHVTAPSTSASTIRIANDVDSSGTLWVGGGATLATNGGINVGYEGQGTLVVTGQVNAAYVAVPNGYQAAGTIQLSGGTLLCQYETIGAPAASMTLALAR